MGVEKRRFKRAKCQIHAFYQHVGTVGHFPLIETTIMDISESGVRFRSNECVPTHTRLLLRLDIPKRRVIEAAIQTMWVREIPSTHQYEIGACYEALPERDKSLIREITNEFVDEDELV